MTPGQKAKASSRSPFDYAQMKNMRQAAAPFNKAIPRYTDANGKVTNKAAHMMRSGIIKTAGFMGQRTSANFMFGMGNKSYGRLGLAGGLGIMAIGQAGKSIDRAQYGNYTGAALSAGMAGAAGAAAYSAYHLKSSYRDHLSNAASKIMKNIFR